MRAASEAGCAILANLLGKQRVSDEAHELVLRRELYDVFLVAVP